MAFAYQKQNPTRINNKVRKKSMAIFSYGKVLINHNMNDVNKKKQI